MAGIANRLKNDYIRCHDMWQRSIAGYYQNNIAWLYIDHQAARLLPIGRESLVLDYRSEPQSPGALLIIAAKRKEVAQWQHCLHRAGLTPDVLDIVPCSLRTMAQLAGVASDSLLLHRLDTITGCGFRRYLSRCRLVL